MDWRLALSKHGMMGCHLDSESRNLFIGPRRGTGNRAVRWDRALLQGALGGGGGEKEEKGR